MKQPFRIFQLFFIILMLFFLRSHNYPLAILTGLASALSYLFRHEKK